MIDLTKDVHSMTAFKRDIARFLERLRESGRPLVLTKNGKADFVVLTAASFQRLWDLADQMEELVAIRRGLDEADAGRTVPLDRAFDEIRRRHGVSDSHRETGT
jgi:prevent-host-death family protein